MKVTIYNIIMQIEDNLYCQSELLDGSSLAGVIIRSVNLELK